jgi:hypothetical protein
MIPLQKLVRLSSIENGGEISPPTSSSTRINNQIKILEKYRKELTEHPTKLTFSHLSHHLTTAGVLKREDVWEIATTPSSSQMSLVFQKLVQALLAQGQDKHTTTNDPTNNKSGGGGVEVWTIILRALNVHHSGFTVKLDTELHKLGLSLIDQFL